MFSAANPRVLRTFRQYTARFKLSGARISRAHASSLSSPVKDGYKHIQQAPVKEGVGNEGCVVSLFIGITDDGPMDCGVQACLCFIRQRKQP